MSLSHSEREKKSEEGRERKRENVGRGVEKMQGWGHKENIIFSLQHIWKRNMIKWKRNGPYIEFQGEEHLRRKECPSVEC